jgi:hypothetical protein
MATRTGSKENNAWPGNPVRGSLKGFGYMKAAGLLRPVIVIAAYNRVGTLTRLLDTVNRAAYPDGEIKLVISIDRGSHGHDHEVQQVAEDFSWHHGKKCVFLQEKHLGLVNHIYWCSSLSKEYGSIILLEDDLYLSPAYYSFASQALTKSQAARQIAGISLYSLWFNGYTQQPFIPLPDENDIFFLQVPYSQGQAFTGTQWQRYEDWMATGDTQIHSQDSIHPLFMQFKAEEWFPSRTKYLVENDLYYIYPRQSLATSFGDAGTHFSRPSPYLQTPLQRYKTKFIFRSMEESAAVYDSFFEIHPSRLARLAPDLKGISFDVDLYGTKRPHHLYTSRVVTTRACRSPLMKFAKDLWPLEANLIDGIRGEGISLCMVEDLKWDWMEEMMVRKSNHDFFSRKRKPARRERLLFWLVEQAEKAGLIKPG